MSPDISHEAWLTNQSQVSFKAGVNNLTVYSNTIRTPIVGPVLKLHKSTDAAQAAPGNPVNYSVVVSNSGSLPANVVLFDDIPAGMSFVPNSVQRNGIPIPGADPRSGIPLGNIGIQDSVRISLQLILLPSAFDHDTREVSNRMRADYTFRMSDGRVIKDTVLSNTVTLPIEPAGHPVIFTRLSVNKHRAVPGDILRYTLFVVNTGNLAGDVELLSIIPQGTMFVRNSLIVNGHLRSGDIPTSGIPLGRISPGARYTIVFDAAVPGFNAVYPGQVYRNSAQLRTTYADSGGGTVHKITDSNTVEVELFFPVIRAEVMVSPGIVYPEGLVEFTITLRNTGNLSAILAAARLLPGQLLLVPGSIRVNGVPYSGTGQKGTMVFGELSPQEVMTITLLARVSPLALSPIIRGNILFQYTYTLHDLVYNSEVSSNPYEMIIEHEDE